jgi:hypothetical protein
MMEIKHVIFTHNLGRLYQITLNFGSIELQFITGPVRPLLFYLLYIFVPTSNPTKGGTAYLLPFQRDR